ncbi:MMPL family transporter [Vagococcus entomophilus]|uniref:SSD domain-containing protein n=1 Tax=Vagococcus entomophilus TaxID=1160095 RepID=A0A430AFD6_9ENTE|nr:MMPL family transporter [Vagococcus entomophilus]RSU06434.1 hypothetical protein CBF30_09270 [Vagococcus entomophilus]
MKKTKEKKYIGTLIIWLGLFLLALITMPNISQIVRDKGQITLPSDLESKVADKMSKKFDKSQNGAQLIVVFNSKKELSEEQNTQIKESIQKLKNEKQAYSITSITSATDNEETKKQVVSKDKTTQMALINVKKQDNLSSLVKKIQDKLEIKSLNVSITGSEVLNNEFSTTTEKGIEKTELIAVLFIFVVLVFVFKSPIVPIISLLTVAVSLIISLNIIMNLTKFFDFPISNFTQVFLIVVLFGIGTDYNILLYDHFKEELAKETRVAKAAKAAHKKAGRAILYSGISVLIGFAVLIFAKFSFYQSAVGVAIGVAVLILNLLSFNLFFMNILGKKMFWPSKKFDGTSSSILWDHLSKAALAKPVIVLGLIVIFALPFISIYQNQTLNFNNADEIQDTNSAKKGYLLIQEHFSKGMTAPTTLYIESKTELTNQEDLATLDKLTEYLKKESGVKSVASVTQPSGDRLAQLYLNKQLSSVTAGLTESTKGMETIRSGLQSASAQLKGVDLQTQLQSVQTLADGSNAVASGSTEFSSGVTQYTAGVNTVSSGLGQLQSGNTALANGISQVSAGGTALSEQVKQLQAQVDNLKNVQVQVQTLTEQMPELGAVLASSGIRSESLGQLSDYYAQLNSGTAQLATALNQINEQMPNLTSGTASLVDGSKQLSSSGTVLVQSSGQLAEGSAQVNTGVQTLNSQMQGLSGQVTTLTNGLDAAVTGLAQVKTGLNTMQNYLKEMQDSYLGKEIYIPKQVLKENTLKPSYDVYLSKDRKMAKITVVFKEDPSMLKTAKKLQAIVADTKARLKGTSLEKAKIAFGGQTSETADLENLATSDFKRTAIIMLIGIGIALVFVTQSILQPVTIIATLLIAYIASLSITNVFSNLVLGKALLTWNTPFFSFIMLVALGVDYSIFLMIRYRDNKQIDKLKAVASIQDACKIIGSVILSAAVILGGTFAALIPSGVTTLIQVALAVMIGLLLLVIMLPLVTSAVVKLTEEKK